MKVFWLCLLQIMVWSCLEENCRKNVTGFRCRWRYHHLISVNKILYTKNITKCLIDRKYRHFLHSLNPRLRLYSISFIYPDDFLIVVLFYAPFLLIQGKEYSHDKVQNYSRPNMFLLILHNRTIISLFVHHLHSNMFLLILHRVNVYLQSY